MDLGGGHHSRNVGGAFANNQFFKMPGGIPEGCSRLDIGWHIKLGRGLARFIMTEH